MAEQEIPFQVTAAHVARYDWPSIIAVCKEKQCEHYFDLLGKKSSELGAAGDETGKQVFKFLATICSYHANYDSTGNPYGPLWRSGDQRAVMADDLTDADLQALSDLLPTIEDTEFRARAADILWECKKDHKAARVAVDAFIASAKALEGGEFWSPSVDRLERALQLSAKLGYGKDLYQNTLRTVEEAVTDALRETTSGLKAARLMDVLIAFRAGEPNHYAQAAETFAKQLSQNDEWNFAEEYWWVASRWYRRAKREEDALRAEIEAAETMVQRAEVNLAGPTPSYMFASHWLGKGLEAMRQARAPQEKTEALHTRFLEVQQLSITELKTIELNYSEIPGLNEKLDEAAKLAQEHVQGRTFEDAVLKLAFVAQPTDVDELRERVRRHAKEFVFSAIMPGSAITRSGKIADSSPAVGIGPAEDVATAETKNMFLQAREIDWPTRATARIEPARRQIQSEHPIRLNDFRWLVTYNAFIPPGHAGIYARGLQAGFLGDWLVASHLLIPQLEASIRAVFQQRRIPTSSLENGIQQERDLGWLLNHAQAIKSFGSGIVFDLRGLLTEDFGWNLRNDQAHGLIPENGFYSEASVLVWWLTLRLCVLGNVSAMKQREREQSSASLDAP